MTERLQKLIAQSGLCSRRKAEELLLAGRVTVDGAVAALGDKADPAVQTVAVDGKVLNFDEEKVYLMLHKPRGYVTTLCDEKGRRTAAELVEACGVRVYPVGRLDMDSEGLLLFTNDGDFMQTMTHPKHQVDKVYEVTVTGALTGAETRLAAVCELDGEPIVPAQVTVLERRGGQALLQVVIHQGKNRQVRRMCAQVGLQVKRLRRVAEDSLLLGDLPAGKWRYLTKEELHALKGREG
ncbi:MAG: rRNA pseudouridine synthase [Oscillospiraceae bacterium]|nr:rRNA pseudouridine synthase [Oscillospiraceae bacterium]